MKALFFQRFCFKYLFEQALINLDVIYDSQGY